MHEMVYNDINRSKIVYPTGQGQTGFKPDSSPWPPDYKELEMEKKCQKYNIIQMLKSTLFSHIYKNVLFKLYT